MNNDTTQAEIWKPVVGYEGWYEISNLGRVKRVKAGKGTWVGKMLVPSPNTKGYLTTVVRKNGKAKTIAIHREVANAFLEPKPSPKHEVNHIDTVRTNNKLSNLEWLTHADNIKYSFRTGKASNIGKLNPRAKLTEDDVRAIKNDFNVNKEIRGYAVKLAERYAVNVVSIRSILNGKTWGHIQC